jgi:hypothetical protein
MGRTLVPVTAREHIFVIAPVVKGMIREERFYIRVLEGRVTAIGYDKAKVFGSVK